MEWFQHYWWAVLLVILASPVAAAMAFASWLKRQPGLQLDAGVKCWDVFIKVISAFTVIVSGVVLMGKYVDQQDHAERQRASQEQKETNLRTAEFLRQVLIFDTEAHQKRGMLFAEAKKIASRLANARSPAAADIQRFDELYDADLIGIEGRTVEAAMVRFRRKLRNDPNAPGESLERLALELSTACKEELAASQAALLKQHETILALATGTKP